MKREEFLEYLRRGNPVTGGSDMHLLMHELAAEALKETAELNGSYHEPEEMRRLFSKIIGKPVDDSFSMFPPFYTECGKNIYIGKNVFINCGCHFQDHGGVYIGDNVLVGSYVVFATINHGQKPEDRSSNYPAPIHIGNGVWIGSHATILPGVTVGDNAVIAAGAVVNRDVPKGAVAVNRDVPKGAVAGGVQAKVIKYNLCDKGR